MSLRLFGVLRFRELYRIYIRLRIPKNAILSLFGQYITH